MRAQIINRILFSICVCAPHLSFGADVAPNRLQPAIAGEINQSLHYWKETPVGNTAQLLTLFCKSCAVSEEGNRDIPLVAVLRDTLGDNVPENDRVTYVWLMSYVHPNMGQRILSAIPFFYWRIGKGTRPANRSLSPLLDLSAPQHPVISQLGRDVLQWTTLDPMMLPIRATSRAYRTNSSNQERLHLEEAISYFRQAPACGDRGGLTQTQIDTAIARLSLRKKLLGGLVSERRAAQLGREAEFEEERIRSRNWELLRQWAEKTGLVFEPLNLAGTEGRYAILWLPVGQSPMPGGVSLKPIWKLLNIKDPWTDDRLRNGGEQGYKRAYDQNGRLLPLGQQGGERKINLVPLGIYSLSYPKLPLLLMDFRDKLRVRRHEMTQRTIDEITAGVIGISHFTNWYYYVGADMYGFVAGRHGSAVDRASRLDCYSQFRVALALDRTADPDLREEIMRHLDSLAMNPLEAAPEREMQNAAARWERLQGEAGDNGVLVQQLDKQRRLELAAFSQSPKTRIAYNILHDLTFGFYTHRAKESETSLAQLDRNRRVAYQMALLDSLVDTGTPPEIAYDGPRIATSLTELADLLPSVQSEHVRAHAAATLERLKALSKDTGMQADCSIALVAMKRAEKASKARGAGIATLPRGVQRPRASATDALK